MIRSADVAPSRSLPDVPTRRVVFVLAATWMAMLAACPAAVAGQDADAATEPKADTLAALVQRLGDPDFQRREAASAELQAQIGRAHV